MRLRSSKRVSRLALPPKQQQRRRPPARRLEPAGTKRARSCTPSPTGPSRPTKRPRVAACSPAAAPCQPAPFPRVENKAEQKGEDGQRPPVANQDSSSSDGPLSTARPTVATRLRGASGQRLAWRSLQTKLKDASSSEDDGDDSDYGDADARQDVADASSDSDEEDWVPAVPRRPRLVPMSRRVAKPSAKPASDCPPTFTVRTAAQEMPFAKVDGGHRALGDADEEEEEEKADLEPVELGPMRRRNSESKRRGIEPSHPGPAPLSDNEDGENEEEVQKEEQEEHDAKMAPAAGTGEEEEMPDAAPWPDAERKHEAELNSAGSAGAVEHCPVCDHALEAASGDCRKCALYAADRVRLYHEHVNWRRPKADKFLDRPVSLDKVEDNRRLVAALPWLLERCQLPRGELRSLTLDGGDLYSSTCQVEAGLLPANITVPNAYLHAELSARLDRGTAHPGGGDGRYAALRALQLRNALVYDTIHLQPAGRPWQLVFLDYCCLWSGNRATDPARDLVLLLRRRLLDSAGALLGLTVSYRNSERPATMEAVRAWVERTVAEHGYRCHFCETRSHAPVHFLLFALTGP